MMKILEAER
jgi:hypothetical protein